MVTEKISHHSPERAYGHTGFAGNTQVGMTHDHSVVILLQCFGRADTYTGGIIAPAAGKPEDRQFTDGFKSAVMPAVTEGLGQLERRIAYQGFPQFYHVYQHLHNGTGFISIYRGYV
jgi:hypothetical protein